MPRLFAFPQHRILSVPVLILGVLIVVLFIPGVRAEAVDANSKTPGTIEFKASNLFGAAKGSFGEWRVVESVLDLDAIERSHATVEVTLESLDTGIGRRDRHLRTADFFDIEQYPIAIVRAHSLVPSGETEGGNPRYSVQFDVDLHGVKKTLSGEVELVRGAPVIANGSVSINRLDFGIGSEPSRWNPMSIESDVPVEFSIVF